MGNTGFITIWLPIITFIFGGVISWAGNWYFSERRKVSINHHTTVVISNDTSYEKIGITYDGGTINQLCHTLVEVKNAGNKELLRDRITGD